MIDVNFGLKLRFFGNPIGAGSQLPEFATLLLPTPEVVIF